MAYTLALLHFNGDDGSSTFTDECGNSWSKGATSAQLDTAEYKFGGSSLLLNVNDVITTTSSVFNNPTNTFTFDFWVKFNALDHGGDYNIFRIQDGNNASIWKLITVYVWNANRYIRYYDFSGVNVIYFSANYTSLTTGTWYHFAVVYDNKTPYIFVDGYSQTLTISASGDTVSYDSNSTTIGRGTSSLNGWIDEFRYSKGIARWTSDFTVPSREYIDYSRGNYAVLPTNNDNDLETSYSAQDIIDISNNDTTRVPQIGLQEYMIHEYKDYVGTANSCDVSCDLQTDLDPSLSTVYLQIFNRSTNEWNTIDSYNSSTVSTDFTLSGTVSDLTNYKDESTLISCRIYQLAI